MHTCQSPESTGCHCPIVMLIPDWQMIILRKNVRRRNIYEPVVHYWARVMTAYKGHVLNDIADMSGDF